MTRTGFDDAEEPGDREPEGLSAWLAAGFAREDAEVWRQWRFTIAESTTWKQQGVTDGLLAAQWRTAAATPETVADWQSAGIDAAEAVHWHEFGFTLAEGSTYKKTGFSPQQAFARQQQQRQGGVVNMVRSGRVVGSAFPGGPPTHFHQVGIDHQLIHGYLQHQWADESAVEWARQGIEAQDAYVWYDLGLTAREAGRLVLQGRTPGDVVREWWTAGIPFQEMAEWIGAGLSAHEAVEQRGNGITVEHAASLRALRRGDAGEDKGERLPAALLARTGPPRLEPIGPPPDDEDAARSEIRDAYSGMLSADGMGNIVAVERGTGLAAFLQEAARRHGIPEGEPGDGATVTADFIRFVNDHEARVSYTVVVGPPRNMTLGGRTGRAVVQDGCWKVARETFAEFMRMGGVECPPDR